MTFIYYKENKYKKMKAEATMPRDFIRFEKEIKFKVICQYFTAEDAYDFIAWIRVYEDCIMQFLPKIDIMIKDYNGNLQFLSLKILSLAINFGFVPEDFKDDSDPCDGIWRFPWFPQVFGVTGLVHHSLPCIALGKTYYQGVHRECTILAGDKLMNRARNGHANTVDSPLTRSNSAHQSKYADFDINDDSIFLDDSDDETDDELSVDEVVALEAISVVTDIPVTEIYWANYPVLQESAFDESFDAKRTEAYSFAVRKGLSVLRPIFPGPSVDKNELDIKFARLNDFVMDYCTGGALTPLGKLIFPIVYLVGVLNDSLVKDKRVVGIIRDRILDYFARGGIGWDPGHHRLMHVMAPYQSASRLGEFDISYMYVKWRDRASDDQMYDWVVEWARKEYGMLPTADSLCIPLSLLALIVPKPHPVMNNVKFLNCGNGDAYLHPGILSFLEMCVDVGLLVHVFNDVCLLKPASIFKYSALEIPILWDLTTISPNCYIVTGRDVNRKFVPPSLHEFTPPILYGLHDLFNLVRLFGLFTADRHTPS